MVIVESKAEKVSPAGLILSESVSNQGPLRGRVVAVGTGKRMKRGSVRPLDVYVGDMVLVAAFAGTKVTVDRQDALIIREEDILGVENVN